MSECRSWQGGCDVVEWRSCLIRRVSRWFGVVLLQGHTGSVGYSPKNMSQKRVTLTKAFLASMPSRMEALPDGVLQLLDSNLVSSEELERLVPDYNDDDVKKGRQRSLEVLMLLALQRSPIDALKALFAAPAQVSGRVIPQAFNLTCCGIRRMGVIQPNLLRYPDRTTRSSSCIPTSSSSCASGCCNASSCTSYF